MKFIKKLIQLVFSDYIISRITSISYGWHGNYSSWELAKSKCTGYDEEQILDRVLENALKVKNGEIPFERDSVPFDRKVYSFPVLSALMWIAVQNQNKLNIIDFGGSLGTSYYQNINFLETLTDVNWCVIEQPQFVSAGLKHFKDKNLHFFTALDDCQEKYEINAILLSSVIQYIEKPYDLLEDIISRNFEYIIIDRTLFLEKDEGRLTIQKVPKRIYNASYCCWFLSESKFLSVLLSKYQLIYDFEITERINIKSLYKGYLFKLKHKYI